MTFMTHVWHVMLALSPWMIVGAIASGVLHYVLPPGFANRQLSGTWGVVKAVLLGVPLPLCSCGVIPAGIGLKRDGASSGASVGFLVATPQTGVDSVLVSAGMLGWPFALWKVVAAVVTGLVAGWTTEVVDPSGDAAVMPATTSSPRTVAAATEHAVDVLRSIWGWLVFGVLLSAALSTWMPMNGFTELTGASVGLAFGAALLVSLPLYVCATASVPIAAALVAGGMPTGAALVFLMAGPATNVATLGVVYRTFNRSVLVVYLGSIVLGSIAFGWLYQIGVGELVATASADAHAHASLWETGSAVLLTVVILGFALQDARSWMANRGIQSGQSIHVDVAGMSCGGCANKLQRALLATEGVSAAVVSHEAGTAEVTGTIGREKLDEVIRLTGFEPRANP